ncbi:MAG TPA: hypothetical protein VMW87_06185 [Spirochaetia bacterium]|nr:hypothetical protein [Spirochaetia bacterium]
MVLYHFATAQNAKLIKRLGLTKGTLMWPLRDGRYMKAAPLQWLTVDREPARQHWATDRTGTCGNRLEARIAFEIPRLEPGLYRWNEFAIWTLHSSQGDLAEFNSQGGADGSDWYVYVGRIPARRIVSALLYGDIAIRMM